jgi:unsaturated chondroitin disaccharide hydrolase
MTDEYLKDLYDKLTAKLTAECRRIGSIIPYISVNGRYKDLDIEHDGICWWTNGFWPGILWQMYNATKDESFRETAVKVENRLDNAFEVFTGLHHDVGFMWLHSSVANHRLTGCSDAYRRSLHAAGLLAGRYNPDARYIRAWNGNNVGYTIVDTMMNLPLLYWAGQELGDPRFKQIATHHADTCMRVTVRSDGSTNHIVNLDPNTGDVLSVPEGQGYAPDSTWSRGNAWALYGFALSYRHSGQKKYLDTAKKIAHYFTVNLAINDWLPLVDFRAPKNPVYYDSTAAMIAVCGLLEIAEHVSDTEKDLYIASATKTLSACENKFCDWNPETDGILGGGTVAYHSKDSNNVPIIYGDYFLTEAILRLSGKHFHIW